MKVDQRMNGTIFISIRDIRYCTLNACKLNANRRILHFALGESTTDLHFDYILIHIRQVSSLPIENRCRKSWPKSFAFMWNCFIPRQQTHIHWFQSNTFNKPTWWSTLLTSMKVLRCLYAISRCITFYGTEIQYILTIDSVVSAWFQLMGSAIPCM